MILFFSRISPETVEEDVIEFIQPALRGGMLKKSGQVRDVNIMILKDILLDKLEYHALVTIEPDPVAIRVHKKLNRKPINGKHVAIRSYVSRSWHTDLRVNRLNLHTDLIDRRIGDRRRGYRMKVVDNMIGMFKARKVFM